MKDHMILEILKHDGPVRLGKLHFDDYEITTPNFLFTSTKIEHDIYLTSHRRKVAKKPCVIDYGSLKANKEIGDFGILPDYHIGYDVPKSLAEVSIRNTVDFAKEHKRYGAVIQGSKYPDLREKCAKELKDHPLLAIANGDKLIKNPRLLVEIVTRVREAISPNSCLYFPFALPHQFPLLAYMGVDIFDSIGCVIKARERRMITPRGFLSLDKIKELPCSCSVCIDKKPEDLRDNFDKILRHNFNVMTQTVKGIREAIRKGNFRELVEEKAACDVDSMTTLRLLDEEKQDFLERYTRIY